MENELFEVPISIQNGFPQTLTDEELKNKIIELSNGVVTTEQTSFADKYSALCQIALNEINNRHFEKEQAFFKKQADQNTVTTKKSLSFSRFGLFFSTAAIILSVTSVYFSNKGDNADSVWQKMQRTLLQNSISEQKITNHLLDSLIRQDKFIKNSKLYKQANNNDK